MAGRREPADCFNVEDTIERFKIYETPLFSFWCGKDLRFIHQKDDMNGALNLLTNNLETIKQNGHTSQFTIKVYDELPERGKITAGTEHSGSIVCQMHTPGDTVTGMTRYGSGGGGDFMAYLKEELSQAKEKIHHLKQDRDYWKGQVEHLEQAGNDDNLGGLGKVGSALEKYPQLNELLKPVIMNLSENMANLFGKKIPASRISGIPLQPADDTENQKKLSEAITALISAYGKQYNDMGDTIFAFDMEKLSRIAQHTPSVFLEAIQKLREL